MNSTQAVAWIGACTGVASLGWNIYTKLTAGPKLRVTAYAGMVQMPPPPGNPRFLRVTVQNIGTQPTTVTNVSFFRYKSRWARWRYRPESPAALMNEFSGPRLPHKLEVGGEWMASMQEDEKFEGWVCAGLWCAVHHAFENRPTQVKIYMPELEKRTAQDRKGV